MLANVVEPGLAVSVGPEPAFAAIEAGAVVTASGRIPERDGDVVSVHPLPISRVLRVADCSHPILAAAVASVEHIRGQF